MPEQAPITGITVTQRTSAQQDALFYPHPYPEAVTANRNDDGSLSLYGARHAEGTGANVHFSARLVAEIAAGFWSSYTVDHPEVATVPLYIAGGVSITVSADLEPAVMEQLKDALVETARSYV